MTSKNAAESPLTKKLNYLIYEPLIPEDNLFPVGYAVNSANWHKSKPTNTLKVWMQIRDLQHFIWRQGIDLELLNCETEEQGNSFWTLGVWLSPQKKIRVTNLIQDASHLLTVLYDKMIF